MSGHGQQISYVELSAFCDGALSVKDMERVAEALETDPELRATMSKLMADRDALLTDTDVEPNDASVDALAARLQDTIDRQQKRRRQVRMMSLFGSATALIAAGWLAHVAYMGPVTTPEEIAAITEAGVPLFIADAAGAHEIFARDEIHPVEFTASDESIMRDWFKQHLGDHAVVPHLQDLGFRLVGGRLLGDSQGATAQLIYENDDDAKVSLFFSKRPVSGGTEVRLVKVGKSFASYWQDHELAWAVVEDSPGADISMIADHVSKLPKAESGE